MEMRYALQQASLGGAVIGFIVFDTECRIALPLCARSERMKCASLIAVAPKAKAAIPYLAQHFPRVDRQQCGLKRRSSNRSDSLEFVGRMRLVRSQQ